MNRTRFVSLAIDYFESHWRKRIALARPEKIAVQRRKFLAAKSRIAIDYDQQKRVRAFVWVTLFATLALCFAGMGSIIPAAKGWSTRTYPKLSRGCSH